MRRPRVLVADDENPIRTALRKIIDEMGCDVTPVCDGRQALDALGRGTYQLVITDLRMPPADGVEPSVHGFEVVRRAAEQKVPAIVLTGFGTVDSAVEAMRLGATDFLTKPFEVEQVERVVRAALAGGAPQAPGAARPGSGSGRPSPGSLRIERPPEQPLIGRSPAMEQVRLLVGRLADSDGTVLLTGESGTGKEVVAHLIHERSRRRDGPFIAVNCAAIPEQLLESELFGHSRGSFTGATQARTGRFSQAAGGTLFLDEIAEMSPALQAKVLRVLQDKEVTPVGASRPQRVDVRIIAATNRDLQDMVSRGRFREDLYYRLYVLPIHLPPLRARPEDLPALCDHFLGRACAKRGQAAPPLREVVSEAALERLRAHGFPGNVRELENLIERVVHLRREGQVMSAADLPLEAQRTGRTRPVSGGPATSPAVPVGGAAGSTAGPLQRADMPEWLAAASPHLPDGGVDLRDQMGSYEKSFILQALQRAGGSRKVAAELLRIKRTTLVMMMRRHRIDDAGRPMAEDGEDEALEPELDDASGGRPPSGELAPLALVPPWEEPAPPASADPEDRGDAKGGDDPQGSGSTS